MSTEQSIQDRDFADGNCFGCGPTNPAGLHIKSYKEFSIEFLRPTPMEPLELVARVVDLRKRSAAVEAEALASDETCVRFRGVFVVPRVRATPSGAAYR
jgi:hypothetical protein